MHARHAIFLLLGILFSADYAFPSSLDSSGRLIEVISPTGARIVFVYDPAGNITGMTSIPNSNANPVLTSETTLFGQVGVNFSETLVSNKPATVFAEKDLASGLALQGDSGVISGIPTTPGVFPAKINLNASGHASNVEVTIHIRPATAIAWPRYAGTYSGTSLATPSSSSAGTATITVTAGGKFSGTFFYQGQRIALTGTFSPTGSFARTLTITGLHDTVVYLSLDPFTETITGSISDGHILALVETTRPRVTGDNATLEAGRWTFLLQFSHNSPSVAPKGSGFGIAKIKKTAAGTLVGSLPDGAKLSGKFTINKRRDATFLTNLYNKRGLLVGTLSFDSAPLASGNLHWSHPALTKDNYFKAAFETDLILRGSRFTAAAPGMRIVNFADAANNGKLDVGQNSLSAPLSRVFTLATTNKGLFPPPNSEKLTLAISKTGLFSGSFLENGSKNVLKFNGIMLQELRIGAGYFLGDPISGLVEVGPNP